MRCLLKAHSNLPIFDHTAWAQSKFGKSVIIRRGRNFIFETALNLMSNTE